MLVKITALVLPLALETFAASAALAVGGRSTGWRTRSWILAIGLLVGTLAG